MKGKLLLGALLVTILVFSGIISPEVTTGNTLAEQPISEGYHRAPFTLTDETLTVVEPFIIMDAAFNFTLFVACNDTTGFLQVNITQETSSTVIIHLGGGANTTRSLLSGGFGVSLYSNGTSRGYYWYDAHIQGGGWPLPPLIWLLGIVIVVIILCVLFIIYRRK